MDEIPANDPLALARCLTLRDERCSIAIKTLRADRGLSQAQFAKLAGVDRSYIAQFETQRSWPPPHIQAKLLAALGFTPQIIEDALRAGIVSDVKPSSPLIEELTANLNPETSDEWFDLRKRIFESSQTAVMSKLAEKAQSGDVRAQELYCDLRREYEQEARLKEVSRSRALTTESARTWMKSASYKRVTTVTEVVTGQVTGTATACDLPHEQGLITVSSLPQSEVEPSK